VLDQRGRLVRAASDSPGDLQLTRYDERGWRATFYTTGMQHSPTSVLPGARRVLLSASPNALELSRAREGSARAISSYTIGRVAAMMKVPTARILVIDDNPEVVDILVTCLREAGYGVLGALTGDEGMKDFVLSRPDLVLLDIALPDGMDGIELLKRIRSINPTARVIMVTGNTDPQLARQALELGAVAYIDKPFDFDYLKRVVAMALQPQTWQPDNHSQT
jgi:CheY-like chemotaxis protein